MAEHDTHNLELIAAYGAGATDRAETARAAAMVAACAMCAELAADVAAITGALRALQPAAAAPTLPRAPRDFRLTADDARRLRRRSSILGSAGLLGLLAAAGRPAGAALATFGLVGVLIGFGGSIQLAGSAAAPAAAPTEALVNEGDFGAAGVAPAGSPAAGDASGQEAARDVTEPALPWLPIGSVALVLVGLLLVVAGTAAARRGRRASPRDPPG